MNAARARVAGALLVLALLRPPAAHAQAGPWIPVGSRLDGLATWLIAEGGLRGLDPLTRPWRLAELRRAAAEQDSLVLRASGRRVLDWLNGQLALAADSSALTAELGEAFYKNGRRDSFRDGGGSGAGIFLGIWASLSRGPFVAVANPAIENRLKDDPEYFGKTDRSIAGRLQIGYVAATGNPGDLVFGRMARQWGPSQFQGIQLSPSAYAQDQLAGTLRLGRFALTSLAQRLDDQQIDSISLDTPVSRYYFAHRLTINAGRGVWIALTESGVYGGPGRGFEPAFHMPLGLAVLAQVNEQRDVNALWGVEIQAPLGRGVTIAAQGVLDDIQLDDQTITDQRPTSGGFTAVLSGLMPGVAGHWSLGYTRIGALTYRNSFASYEVYALQSVGLGRNFSDYDQVLLQLALRPALSTSVTAEFSYLRQGSGDFRQPFPPDSVLAQPGQGFLVAPVQSGPALRLVAEAEPFRGVLVNGEVGLNDAGPGSATKIAAVAVRLRFDALARRLGAVWGAVEGGDGRPWP